MVASVKSERGELKRSAATGSCVHILLRTLVVVIGMQPTQRQSVSVVILHCLPPPQALPTPIRTGDGSLMGQTGIRLFSLSGFDGMDNSVVF